MAIELVHVSEKPDLGRRLAALILKEVADDLILGSFAPAFADAAAALSAAQAPRSRDASESVVATGVVAKLDYVRDGEARALYYFLAGWRAKRVDPEAASTAGDLIDLLIPMGLALLDYSFSRKSALIDALLANAAQPDVAARIGKLPGIAEAVESLRRVQAEFAAAAVAAPVARAAVTRSFGAVRAAEDAWDGVLFAFIGALRRRYPGTSAEAKASREALLAPLREIQAREKARRTLRTAPAAPPAPSSDPPSSSQ